MSKEIKFKIGDICVVTKHYGSARKYTIVRICYFIQGVEGLFAFAKHDDERGMNKDNAYSYPIKPNVYLRKANPFEILALKKAERNGKFTATSDKTPHEDEVISFRGLNTLMGPYLPEPLNEPYAVPTLNSDPMIWDHIYTSVVTKTADYKKDRAQTLIDQYIDIMKSMEKIQMKREFFKPYTMDSYAC